MNARSSTQGLAAAAAFLLVAALAASAAPALRVVATIFPIASIVQEVGGERVRVTAIVPSGICPHEFEIMPTAAKAIDEADVAFLIAQSFDGWAIPADKAAKGPRWVEFAKLFGDSLIKLGDGINPHFWLDPLFAKQMGWAVARELCQLDSAGCSYYDARATAFAARLDSLDAAVRARLAKCTVRDFVALHPAWSYFARRYDLKERDVLEISPEQEPSAKWVAEVLKRMKRDHIKLVLGEEGANEGLARMVAKESGARLIVLDPLGDAAKPGRNSYFSLIDHDVTKLEQAR